ncbi:hypothetical protein SRABI106_01390 [Rahnella aquatilis]|nr:hypothetical protein SRABI106_01390 [Rahnella aquatilis]
MFRIQIQRFELGVIAHMQCKRIILCLRIAMCTRIKLCHATLFCILFTVKTQVALRINFLRRAVEPEVHQVKMVGRFVHQQAAGIAFFTVPATKIISPVFGIQQPFKVHRKYFTDGFLHQQFTHFAVMRRVAVIERHTHLIASCIDGIQNAQRALFIDGHRLFSNDVTTGMQGADDIIVMCAIHAGDNHDIRFGFVEHRIEISRFPGRYPCDAALLKLAVRIIHSRLICITEGHKFCVVAVFTGDRFNV